MTAGRRRVVWFVAIVALTSPVLSCYQYRQQALGITPASECPDFSRGCATTQWRFGYAGFSAPDSCGTVGLSEVTLRDRPHFFLLSVATLGLVSAKRVEWKCARPAPSGGNLFANVPVRDSMRFTGARGRRTGWGFLWGAVTSGLPSAQCGDVGLAEVTVGDRPHFFLLTLVSGGTVSPRRVQWRCAGPDSASGNTNGPVSPLSMGGR